MIEEQLMHHALDLSDGPTSFLSWSERPAECVEPRGLAVTCSPRGSPQPRVCSG
jgi:hypothetical protein